MWRMMTIPRDENSDPNAAEALLAEVTCEKAAKAMRL